MRVLTEGWKAWLCKSGEPCGELGVFPVAPALDTTRDDTFVEHFPCARRWAKELNLDYPI